MQGQENLASAGVRAGISIYRMGLSFEPSASRMLSPLASRMRLRRSVDACTHVTIIVPSIQIVSHDF